jgi:peptide chain release factor 3
LIRYLPEGVDPTSLKLMQSTRRVTDLKGRNLLIFTADYEIRWAEEKNPGLTLIEFDQVV